MANYMRVIITDDVVRAITEIVKWLRSSEDADWLLKHHATKVAEWLEALEVDENA